MSWEEIHAGAMLSRELRVSQGVPPGMSGGEIHAAAMPSREVRVSDERTAHVRN